MEAPDSDSGGEAIMICIDNSVRKTEYYEAQLEAVRSYATYKIQSDPRTVVGLSTSSRTPIYNPNIRVLLHPTRDLNKIFDSLKRIVRGGELDIVEAIFNCLAKLPFPFSDPPKKRIVMFAGGIISMPVEAAHEFGTCLKNKGIAFDVVNFTLGDKLDLRKKKLEAFVAAVDDNNNSSNIIHVDDTSSLSNLLFRFMGDDAHVEAKVVKQNKDHQLVHSKTSSMKNKNVDVKQPSSSFVDKGMKQNKDHQLIHSKTSRLSSKKKATGIENVDVKRESEPSSSFMAKGMKNKDHQLIHSKTSRLSIKKKAIENENVSSKGGVDHEYVKNTPFKLRNRFEAFSIST